MPATIEQVKCRPIMFSAPMVRAILDGTKTQTRRVCKLATKLSGNYPKRRVYWNNRHNQWMFQGSLDGHSCKQCQERFFLDCPYGKPGDTLWVRESWRPYNVVGNMRTATDCGVIYADGTKRSLEEAGPLWRIDSPNRNRPSIHMPRWASRITLEITDVRVQRLQEISDSDKRDEGATATVPFGTVWKKINTKPGIRWEDNPWVWCISFKRVKP